MVAEQGFGGFRKKSEALPEQLSDSYIFRTEDGNIVDLEWRICKPEKVKGPRTIILPDATTYTVLQERKKTANPDEAILFLPGVGLEADSKSVISSAQEYANASQVNTFSISTRTESSQIQNSQTVQAQAIAQFISDRGLKEVKIVGNSQGAKKSIDLGTQLEAGGQINVEGVIIISPAGLYEQDPYKLLMSFATDALWHTPVTMVREGALLSKKGRSRIGRALGVGADIGAGIKKELLRSPGEFIPRSVREAKEAATPDDNNAKLKAPLVIVVGAEDTNFKSGKLMPETAHNQSLNAQKEREAAMRKIFPNSAGIAVLEATKSSNHGLHYMRSSEVAETSLYMLERMGRAK